MALELARHLGALSPSQLRDRQHAAERAILEMGITFTVYSEGENIDRAWPFDIVSRTLERTELFARQQIQPVDDCPAELFNMLVFLSPRPCA